MTERWCDDCVHWQNHEARCLEGHSPRFIQPANINSDYHQWGYRKPRSCKKFKAKPEDYRPGPVHNAKDQCKAAVDFIDIGQVAKARAVLMKFIKGWE